MTIISTGALRKMTAQHNEDGSIDYQLSIGSEKLALNDVIGQQLTLNYTGEIRCLHCDRKTKKSYSQGYCFPCMQKLAQCDMCMMKPETCHFEQGTCREPQWAQSHCFVPHYVYLANTSGLKVGITRHTQLPTRWIDQGATQALPIFKVNTRHQSGLVEIALAEYIADKTNWRAMLKGHAEDIDLKSEAAFLKPKISAKLADLSLKFGENAIEELEESVVTLQYPILHFLDKITALSFDKTPTVSGVLIGIKGQYLIFEHGVLNVRKFTSYQISASVHKTVN